MQRKFSRRSIVAVGAAASVSAGRSWGQSRPANTRLTVAVADRSAFAALPLVLADQLGYFRAEGLDVDLVEITQIQKGIMASLFSQADVVCGGPDQAISLLARGLPCQTFVLQARAPAVALGMSTKATAPYRHWADLKGRRIGVVAPGSLGHLAVIKLLARAGLSTQDVSFQALGSWLSAVSALRSGQVEALSYPDPAITLLEHSGEIRLVADTRTMKGAEAVFGGPMPAAGLIAPNAFITKHPQAIQGLTHAVVHSLKWLQTAGPSDIIKTVPESYLLGDRALYLGAFNRGREALSPDGLISDAAVRTAALAAAQLDSAINLQLINVATSFTNDFVLRSKTRYRS